MNFDWVIFSEVVDICPSRNIRKGSITKFLSMDHVKSHRKKISQYTFRSFSGGSKFKNGDILFARITPSLEHGKTVFVDFLDEDERGSGSTEFLVFTPKNESILPEFIYYLATTDIVRDPAIKSMSGTSGRQRVDSKIFDQILIPLPSIQEQKSISKILSDLDSKIELNLEMNKTLESIAQALFKHWFIDFEFPDENGNPYKSSGGEMVESELGEIPNGWKIGILSDILQNVKTSVSLKDIDMFRKYVPIDSLTKKSLCIESFSSAEYAKSSLLMFEKDDILVGAMRVYFHRVNLSPFSGITRATTFVLRPMIKPFLSYAVLLMSQNSTIKYANSHSKGTTMPYAVWVNSLAEMPIIIPNDKIIAEFNNLTYPLLSRIRDSIIQKDTLANIKDSLLPKLMSGKIRVPMEEINDKKNE